MIPQAVLIVTLVFGSGMETKTNPPKEFLQPSMEVCGKRALELAAKLDERGQQYILRCSPRP